MANRQQLLCTFLYSLLALRYSPFTLEETPKERFLPHAVERRCRAHHRRWFRPWRRHRTRDGRQRRENRRARPEQGKRRESRGQREGGRLAPCRHRRGKGKG